MLEAYLFTYIIIILRPIIFFDDSSILKCHFNASSVEVIYQYRNRSLLKSVQLKITRSVTNCLSGIGSISVNVKFSVNKTLKAIISTFNIFHILNRVVESRAEQELLYKRSVSVVHPRRTRVGTPPSRGRLQCDQILRNFATLAKVDKSLAIVNCYFLFDQMQSLLWQICDIIRPMKMAKY